MFLIWTAQEFVDAMTLSGSHVEGYEQKDKNLDKIVVGKILTMEKHPDADKLVVCQVDVGQAEPLQIVTGAKNVKVNDLIPLVLDGGKVAAAHGDNNEYPDGIKIKKGKLRGVESNGMMCGIEELGSSREFYPEAPETQKAPRRRAVPFVVPCGIKEENICQRERDRRVNSMLRSCLCYSAQS